MNSIKRLIIYIAVFFIPILIVSFSPAQEPVMPGPTPGAVLPSYPEQQEKTIPIERVSPGVFRLGDILIDKKNRSISFPAMVNMDKGLLEYLLVHSGGKTHESLFRTKVQPYDLQIAFLLLGFEGTDDPLKFQGAPEKPKGESVGIMISYNKNDGKAVTVRPEEWIVKKIQDKPKDVGVIDWIYSGSIIVEGKFLAQQDGSIIAIFRDPVALVDNASPGGESDEVWFVKEGAVPPVGTPVTIEIKAKK